MAHTRRSEKQDRRSGVDRRKSNGHAYKGPERRRGLDCRILLNRRQTDSSPNEGWDDR